MRPPGTTFRPWLCIHFALLSAFLVHAPLAAAQEPPLPSQSHLTSDVRSRLTEAAQDTKLDPWQREFMLGVARGNVEGNAAATAPALSGQPLAPAGIASIDGDWTTLVPAGGTPNVFSRHTAIYDPVRDRMVVFGGYGGNDAVWALSLAGSPAWSALAPAGSPPSGREGHTAIYDPVRDRMVVFGGANNLGIFNDVWALSLAGSSTWTALTPAGSPPPALHQHTAIYDPVRDRMVVFGGSSYSSLPGDVWVLSLAGSPAWSALAPAESPPSGPSGRYGHTAIYDPVRDRMVVYSGQDGTNPSDVWALSLAGSPAWSALAPAGSPPSFLVYHTALYDPVRDRMVVYGGSGFGGLLGDVWALSLAGSSTGTALTPAGSPPPALYQHTAIYDPVRDRMVVFGGNDGVYGGTVWELAWHAPVSVPGDGIAHRFEFALPRPNPSRGETTVDFELAEPARVVMDVFDTQGRRVNRIADAWFTGGRHVSSWRGDDEDGNALGAGVYFIRIRVGGVQATRRTVRVR